jgi:hypothetical protein
MSDQVPRPQPSPWLPEPVARARSPLRRRDTVAVIVSAVLLACLIVLLIVGTLAGGERGDRPHRESPGSSGPSRSDVPKG